jgi:hypothetical protein
MLHSFNFTKARTNMTEEERIAAEKAAQEAAAAEAEKAAAEAASKAKSDKNASDADAAAASAKAETEKAAADLAALQAQLAEAQAKIEKFTGIDPEAARAALKEVEDAKAKAAEAEKAKAIAEGNFERLREIQQEETAAAIKAAQEEAASAKAIADKAVADLQSSRIANAFAGSSFLQKETILSGDKAQRLFGDHVAYEDGQVVVYDKPEGAPGRAMVMNSAGKPLPFDEAIAKVVNADPDKDTLIRSKITPGASSKTIPGKEGAPAVSRHEKLAKGIAALRVK